LDDSNTRLAVTAERAFLEAVGGGCSASVSAHAKVDGNSIEVSAFASTPDGKQMIRERFIDNAVGVDDAAELGTKLGELFVERGARQLVSGEPE
ncbi:MAG: hydroxymethylbilane synthase, partial [Dehalococcoidia bacterium]|nr:hydroxymethylbilane synthase [Dehalococcoidia bacterium]